LSWENIHFLPGISQFRHTVDAVSSHSGVTHEGRPANGLPPPREPTRLNLSRVTETYSSEINGVVMTLGQLVDGLAAATTAS